MVSTKYLRAFIKESNAIENIHDYYEPTQLNAYKDFLIVPLMTVTALVDFVQVVQPIQPEAVLRDLPGMDVRVGNHYPPPGGPGISIKLHELLDKINDEQISLWQAHIDYETLHPFTDGNGRSGRALWLWHTCQTCDPDLLFLHRFYYQTLDAVGR